MKKTKREKKIVILTLSFLLIYIFLFIPVFAVDAGTLSSDSIILKVSSFYFQVLEFPTGYLIGDLFNFNMGYTGLIYTMVKLVLNSAFYAVIVYYLWEYGAKSLKYLSVKKLTS